MSKNSSSLFFNKEEKYELFVKILRNQHPIILGEIFHLLSVMMILKHMLLQCQIYLGYSAFYILYLAFQTPFWVVLELEYLVLKQIPHQCNTEGSELFITVYNAAVKCMLTILLYIHVGRTVCVIPNSLHQHLQMYAYLASKDLFTDLKYAGAKTLSTLFPIVLGLTFLLPYWAKFYHFYGT